MLSVLLSEPAPPALGHHGVRLGRSGRCSHVPAVHPGSVSSHPAPAWGRAFLSGGKQPCKWGLPGCFNEALKELPLVAATKGLEGKQGLKAGGNARAPCSAGFLA